MEPPRLFVYGTLRRGSPNEYSQLLEANSRFVGHGRMQGVLYRFARYPGAMLSDQPDQWVEGELYQLVDPGILIALDRYEGDEFERVAVAIQLHSGGPMLEAWVYLLRRAPVD